MTDYTWDYRNRLTEVTSKTSTGRSPSRLRMPTTTRTAWSARRSTRARPTEQKTVYVYDGNQIVLAFDATVNATNSDPPLAAANLTHRYLSAQAADQLLADEQAPPWNGSDLTQPGNVLWALTDNLAKSSGDSIHNS